MKVANKILNGLTVCMLAATVLIFAKSGLDLPYFQNGVEGTWLKASGNGPEAFTIRVRGDNLKVRFDDMSFLDVPTDGSERLKNEWTPTVWYSANLQKHELIIRKRESIKPVTWAGIPLSQSISNQDWVTSDGRSLTYRNGKNVATYVRPSLRYRLFRAVP